LSQISSPEVLFGWLLQGKLKNELSVKVLLMSNIFMRGFSASIIPDADVTILSTYATLSSLSIDEC
jgi:hypothetical protein